MGFSAKWCLYLIPAVLASFAFMTGVLFSFWCQSVQFTPIEGSSQTEILKYGPWYQIDTVATTVDVGGQQRIFVQDTCVAYPSGAEIDSYMKTVRAFSIMTPIIGGLLTVGLWLAPCFYRLNDGSWKCFAMVFLIVLPLFQGLTFLIYNSSFCTDNSILDMMSVSDQYSSECQWDQGSTANVISVVLWFLTGIAMMAVGCPKRPPRGPPETQAVTYQQTTGPDGTKTVSEAGVVKGTAVPSPAPPVAEEVPMKADDA